MFTLMISEDAKPQLILISTDKTHAKRYKAVQKALGLLQTNPRHPGLNTHKYQGLAGANGEEIFEAYCENRTPGAYRIFWHYGPGKKVISIIAITPHP